MLIAIEGIDGSGKTTLIEALTQSIPGRVLTKRFPDYSTRTGGEIMTRLHDGRAESDPIAFQALQAISRYEMALDLEYYVGNPAMTLVLDRYYLSGIAYGCAAGLDPDWLWGIHAALPRPDLWVYLDVPVAESIRRRPERQDPYERDVAFLRRVRQAYFDALRRLPASEVLTVDAVCKPKTVQNVVARSVLDMYPGNSQRAAKAAAV